jgi:hypothetical protein
MRYEGGRTGVALLANQMEALPHQLYVQLVCQTHLLHDIVGRAVNYFAQRNPATLGEFRWRIDQKDTSKTVYEDAFEKIAPALLQTRSFSEPLERVKGFNYSHFSAYEYEDGKMPDYLRTESKWRILSRVDSAVSLDGVLTTVMLLQKPWEG